MWPYSDNQAWSFCSLVVIEPFLKGLQSQGKTHRSCTLQESSLFKCGTWTCGVVNICFSVGSMWPLCTQLLCKWQLNDEMITFEAIQKFCYYVRCMMASSPMRLQSLNDQHRNVSLSHTLRQFQKVAMLVCHRISSALQTNKLLMFQKSNVSVRDFI